MQELFWGTEKSTLLERCPHFRGVYTRVIIYSPLPVLHVYVPVDIRSDLRNHRLFPGKYLVAIGYIEEIELCVQWSAGLFKLLRSLRPGNQKNLLQKQVSH